MITRLNADFLDITTQVAPESVRLLLTDVPYNISEKGVQADWFDPETGENKNGIHNQKFDEAFEENWDSVSHDDFLKQIDSWAKAWYPMMAKGSTFAIFISDRYISYLWSAMEAAGFEPKRIVTWKKPAAVPFNRKVNFVSGCEFILWGIKPGGKRTFNSDAVLGNTVERNSLADKVSSILYRAVREADPSKSMDAILDSVKAEINKVTSSRKTSPTNQDIIECVIPNTLTYSGGLGKNKIHPTQKPEEILKYLIELCSKPGDLVLDTFAGSGSTGKAAEATGRDCILIERDTKMFAQMNSRFDDNQLFSIG